MKASAQIVVTYLLMVGVCAALAAVPRQRVEGEAGEFFRPPDNLQLEALPPIPLALAARAKRAKGYTASSATLLVDWHPVLQQQMLVTTRPVSSATYQLFAIEEAHHRAPVQVTSDTDEVTWGEYQPVTGKYLVFAKDRDGDERTQLYRKDVETGKVTLLTECCCTTSRQIRAITVRFILT